MSRIYSARDISSHESFDKLHCVRFSCSSFSMNFNGMQYLRKWRKMFTVSVHSKYRIGEGEMKEKFNERSWRNRFLFRRKTEGHYSFLYWIFMSVCSPPRWRLKLFSDVSSSMKNLISMHMVEYIRFECFQMKIDYLFSWLKTQSQIKHRGLNFLSCARVLQAKLVYSTYHNSLWSVTKYSRLN